MLNSLDNFHKYGIALIGFVILIAICNTIVFKQKNPTPEIAPIAEPAKHYDVSKWAKELEPKKLSPNDSINKVRRFNKTLTIAVKYHCSIEDAERLQKGEMWIGMTYQMVVYLRGKPDDVNVSNYGHGKQYQACWLNCRPRCVYFGESGEITAYN